MCVPLIPIRSPPPPRRRSAERSRRSSPPPHGSGGGRSRGRSPTPPRRKRSPTPVCIVVTTCDKAVHSKLQLHVFDAEHILQTHSCLSGVLTMVGTCRRRRGASGAAALAAAPAAAAAAPAARPRAAAAAAGRPRREHQRVMHTQWPAGLPCRFGVDVCHVSQCWHRITAQ